MLSLTITLKFYYKIFTIESFSNDDAIIIKTVMTISSSMLILTINQSIKFSKQIAASIVNNT